MAGKKNNDVHTVPNGSGWSNKQNGEVVSNHHKKANAVEAGRSAARNSHSEHIIHKQNGQISEKNSYGKDPKSSKG